MDELLRQGFRLTHRRVGLIFLDLLWKSIWFVLTLAGLLLVAVWFGSEFRSLELVDTGNRAINGALAFALLRQFWATHRAEIFGALATLAALSVIAWFVLEAAFRSRIVSTNSPPQLRRGEPRRSLGWGGAVQQNQSADQHHPGASRHPSSAEEGSFTFSTFLVSNLLKWLFIASAGLALASICFGRYFSTPISEWPQLWADKRGDVFIIVVAIAALGFLLTILDTLVRNDAVALLGTDLFRVTGLIGILLLFEAMIGGSCAVMLGAGLLNVAGLRSAVAMLATTAVAIGLLNVLHSYLLLVRYSAVGMMRQHVIEI